MRKSGVARATALAAPVHRRYDGGCRTHAKTAAAYAEDASCDRSAKCPVRPVVFKKNAVVRLVA